ncbi:MAG: hypothetical protein GY862_37525 [Gammaproteobacteria bacterium]|nr:hypothetical protein [Gammaproteobacteria bacterium]
MALELKRPDPDFSVLAAKIASLKDAQLGTMLTEFKELLGVEISQVFDGGVF